MPPRPGDIKRALQDGPHGPGLAAVMAAERFEAQFKCSKNTWNYEKDILRGGARAALQGNRAFVGNEFSSVEALWSQFENVMAKNAEGGEKEGQAAEPAAEPATEHAGQEERDGSGEETNVDNGKHCAAKS
ncbi:hypothetical protein BJ878DRAFT_541356 [Calycina marina]|uniref:Uncharacterized protein n=1 Tax=Calycina marina TaxID=1763456 RepID=A0A9P7Z4F0_9HELO|nr:hypothetical protein BJ878DRAFT_541356 [Calycina marina]